jgi:cell division protein FtsZ
MDEVETIQEYLLTQAGPDADVILGLGYDESLGDEISITIIATGFEQKSPFGEQPKEEVKQEVKDERIMFTLDVTPKAQLEPLAIAAPAPEVEQVETIFKEEVVLETPVVFELTPADLVEEPTLILVDETVEELIAEEEHVVVELTDEAPLVFELDVEMGIEPVKLNFEETVVAPIMEKEMIAPEAINQVSQTPSAQGFLVKSLNQLRANPLICA